MSGPRHLDTLTTRGSLACYTGEAGEAAGARDQYAALLATEEQMLGPGHPDTLTTRHSLAGHSEQKIVLRQRRISYRLCAVLRPVR